MTAGRRPPPSAVFLSPLLCLRWKLSATHARPDSLHKASSDTASLFHAAPGAAPPPLAHWRWTDAARPWLGAPSPPQPGAPVVRPRPGAGLAGHRLPHGRRWPWRQGWPGGPAPPGRAPAAPLCTEPALPPGRSSSPQAPQAQRAARPPRHRRGVVCAGTRQIHKQQINSSCQHHLPSGYTIQHSRIELTLALAPSNPAVVALSWPCRF